MARFILAIVAFSVAMALLKLVIVALVIAGLIFRTKETIGFLLLGGMVALISANPVVGLALLALIIVIAAVTHAKRSASRQALEDPDQE